MHLGKKGRRSTAMALVALFVFLFDACTNGSPGPNAPPNTGNGRTSTQSGSNSSRTHRLGEVKETSVSGSCTLGGACRGFVVTCPDLRDPARGFLQILQPNAPSRGLLMFFSGATGQRPWENAERAAASSFEHSIAQDGLEVVLVQWVDPWLDAAPGEQVGPGLLACRPATVIKWVHDTLYRALGVRPSGAACGFCATGSSGGASQIAYALTWYGMGTLLQAAVMTGGPPHAQIAKGCLGIRPFSYGPHAHALDASYGYFGAGPCAAMETGFQSRWVRDSADAPGVQLLFPNTRLVFIEGMRDSSSALPHALAFANEVKSAGSPFLQLYVLPEMDHEVAADPNGLQLLQQSVLAS